MNLKYRPGFLEDAAREEFYLLEHAGVESADAWHEALWETLGFLDRTPLAGRARMDLKFPGIRSWRVTHFERWLIFYAVRGDDLIFYRVMPGTMNLHALELKE
jgi:hypothetical protein